MNDHCVEKLCTVVVAAGIIAVGLKATVATGVLEAVAGGVDLVSFIRREQKGNFDRVLRTVKHDVATNYREWIKNEHGQKQWYVEANINNALYEFEQVIGRCRPTQSDVIGADLNTERLVAALLAKAAMVNSRAYGPKSDNPAAREIFCTIVAQTYERVRTHGEYIARLRTYIDEAELTRSQENLQLTKEIKSDVEAVLAESKRHREVLERLVPQPAHPEVPQNPTRQLSYTRVTEIDLKCIPFLLKSEELLEIEYFWTIAERLRKLKERDDNFQDFLGNDPYHSKITDDREREKRASYWHMHNGRVLRKATDNVRDNNHCLQLLLKRLRDLGAPDDLSRKSLRTFAAFAALRIIRELKRSFDWVDGGPDPQPRFWFEEFKFSSENSALWFDRIPSTSHTAQLVFDYNEWVDVRVGVERDYKWVTFPFRVVLPLFRNGIQGDIEAFYTWVLPQVILYGTDSYSSEEFPIKIWEPFLLQGLNGTEWWSRLDDCPWPAAVSSFAQ